MPQPLAIRLASESQCSSILRKNGIKYIINGEIDLCIFLTKIERNSQSISFLFVAVLQLIDETKARKYAYVDFKLLELGDKFSPGPSNQHGISCRELELKKDNF
jgi:hypothetical protein